MKLVFLVRDLFLILFLQQIHHPKTVAESEHDELSSSGNWRLPMLLRYHFEEFTLSGLSFLLKEADDCSRSFFHGASEYVVLFCIWFVLIFHHNLVWIRYLFTPLWNEECY